MTTEPGTSQRGRGRILLFGLVLVCGLLLAADDWFQRYEDHPLEQYFGFYCVFGFLTLIVVVLLAKVLRRFVQRTGSDYDGY